MKFRIIFTLIALAVIAVGYMLVGGNTQSALSDSASQQQSSPPSSDDDALRRSLGGK